MSHVNSGDEALKVLLIGLCSSDEDHDILNNLCNKVIKVTEDRVAFEEWEFSYQKNKDPMPNADHPKGMPKSFIEIASVVTSLVWDGGGPEIGFELGSDGSSCADGGWLFDEIDELEDEEAAEMERIIEAGDGVPMDAFTAGQNGLFFDPTRKLANGESALAFVNHESCEWEEVRSVDGFDYKQIFLRMLSDAMLSTEHIPEVCF